METNKQNLGAGCIMCSYNRINNSYACENSKTQNGLLKTELGFEGFIVSDWGGQRKTLLPDFQTSELTTVDSGFSSADAGLDLAMPDSTDLWGSSGDILTRSINNGSLAESRVTDMATRILAAWYQMGQDASITSQIVHRHANKVQEGFPIQGIGMPLDYTAPHTPIYARDPASKSVLLDGALEGHVLVKNVNKSLPLKSPKLLSIFGYDAVAPPDLDIARPSNPLAPFTYGYESQLNFDPYVDITDIPSIAPNGTLIVGGETPCIEN